MWKLKSNVHKHIKMFSVLAATTTQRHEQEGGIRGLILSQSLRLLLITHCAIGWKKFYEMCFVIMENSQMEKLFSSGILVPLNEENSIETQRIKALKQNRIIFRWKHALRQNSATTNETGGKFLKQFSIFLSCGKSYRCWWYFGHYLDSLTVLSIFKR